jgi:hypothetical protein
LRPALLDGDVEEWVFAQVGGLLAGEAAGLAGTYSGPTRAIGGKWLIVM